jgi:hypothetical protein
MWYYIENVINGRWPEAEPYIMKDSQYVYQYARDIIKGRWIEAEDIILKSDYAKVYMKEFGVE